MGNLLIPGQLNYLLFPVHSNLSILLNWSYSDVHQVTKKSTRSIYIPTSSLKYFLTNTPASGKESIVVPKFLKPYETKLNIMEVMSSLIAYSSCSLSEKIDLAFEVFDFDHNQVITKDEMVILCLNFLNGISVMTQTPLSTKKFLKTLADEAFSLADSDPDGMITKQELLNWVKSNEVLCKLLDKQSQLPEIKKRLSLLETHGFQLSEQENFLAKISKVKVSHVSPRKRIEISSGHIRRPLIRASLDTWDRTKTSRFLSFDRKAHDVLDKIIQSKLRSGADHLTSRARQAPVLDKEFLKKLFDKYDLDGDGFVTLKEMKKVIGEKLSGKALEMIFKEYDSDSDGFLNFDEFYKMFSPDI